MYGPRPTGQRAMAKMTPIEILAATMVFLVVMGMGAALIKHAQDWGEAFLFGAVWGGAIVVFWLVLNLRLAAM